MITEAGLETHQVSDIADLLARTDGFVWVDITSGDADAELVLSEVFRFHRLAVKDCLERNRVPKMHAYPDCVFVVLHAPSAVREATSTTSSSTSSSATTTSSPCTDPTTPPSPRTPHTGRPRRSSNASPRAVRGPGPRSRCRTRSSPR